MKPELDEKILQIIQSCCIEQLEHKFGITAIIEASGELPGNGIIHDRLVIAKGNDGQTNSFFCALGWEEYIENLIETETEQQEPLNALFERVGSQLEEDGSLLIPNLKLSQAQGRHGSFLSKKSFRIYRSIFFLRDDARSEYCGRLTAYLIA